MLLRLDASGTGIRSVPSGDSENGPYRQTYSTSERAWLMCSNRQPTWSFPNHSPIVWAACQRWTKSVRNVRSRLLVGIGLAGPVEEREGVGFAWSAIATVRSPPSAIQRRLGDVPLMGQVVQPACCGHGRNKPDGATGSTHHPDRLSAHSKIRPNAPWIPLMKATWLKVSSVDGRRGAR